MQLHVDMVADSLPAHVAAAPFPRPHAAPAKPTCNTIVLLVCISITHGWHTHSSLGAGHNRLNQSAKSLS